MDLGTTVQVRVCRDQNNAVYHITKIETDTVKLIAADNSEKHVTPGELIDLYEVVKVEGDIVVRGPDLANIEDGTNLVHDMLKSAAKHSCIMHFGCISQMCI